MKRMQEKHARIDIIYLIVKIDTVTDSKINDYKVYSAVSEIFFNCAVFPEKTNNRLTNK